MTHIHQVVEMQPKSFGSTSFFPSVNIGNGWLELFCFLFDHYLIRITIRFHSCHFSGSF